jgi:hypothetical protein
MTAKIFVRYVGDKDGENGVKQFFIGAPARDMTEEEYDSLDPIVQRDIVASDIYKFETKKAGVEAEAEVGLVADAPESETN